MVYRRRQNADILVSFSYFLRSARVSFTDNLLIVLTHQWMHSADQNSNAALYVDGGTLKIQLPAYLPYTVRVVGKLEYPGSHALKVKVAIFKTKVVRASISVCILDLELPL